MKDQISRRTFVEKSLAIGVALPLAGSQLLSCASPSEKDRPVDSLKKLNILILGGTSFLGPHQIAYAMERGHSITTFTRGKTMPTIHQDLFDRVTMLAGDRASDLSALESGKWDAVIDNSGHNVDWAVESAKLLKDKCDLYLFTSSTGVYYPYLSSDIKEDTELLTAEPEGIEDEEMKIEYWYGVMKTNSEIAVRENFGADRTIVVRPTYMIGPADKSNRFIHWPVRLARGGEVLVPGMPEDPVQYADVRDVAEWMIRLIEEKNTGTFNAAGPASPQGIQDFVQKAAGVFDAESTFVNISDYDFLKANRVTDIVPWIIPIGNNYGSARINNAKGMTNGLTFRKLQDTVADTYEWWYSDALTDEDRIKFEQDPDSVLAREKDLLERWKKVAQS
ncbi:NAD-dependent epimerase/dehydratase family protein [Fulvivirga sedimenti]|uniref:NAD-dependent epimerase/dehydratase family protein n=1 Tax=Fulvivirga sedimenti TaxID=2879465 RepID=A0A9X1HU85_9BACT|nr:NAD-dependent epimerase/dehydratase family protein [Fulvivirga sedimenti]MCA6075090.1 NAD-dependent epimerase/dehydratase family protein [Fulvivirga sedimenti]MCA6076267.1 NAD-dependent epimerase/dehydratase family protein [Fulvivirga sedimenti]MCA6077395.1 NAD-dependent epimerase/dehydratase family protein [Fulvivirga sedimenti]